MKHITLPFTVNFFPNGIFRPGPPPHSKICEYMRTKSMPVGYDHTLLIKRDVPASILDWLCFSSVRYGKEINPLQTLEAELFRLWLNFRQGGGAEVLDKSTDSRTGLLQFYMKADKRPHRRRFIIKRRCNTTVMQGAAN